MTTSSMATHALRFLTTADDILRLSGSALVSELSSASPELANTPPAINKMPNDTA